MASIIDDKLFELITSRENFEFAYDIFERFESITERLYTEFWRDFQVMLKAEYNDYIIEKTDNWEFVFYNRKWKIFMFYFNIKENKMKYGIGSENKDFKNLFPQYINTLQDILMDFELINEKNEFWFSAKCDDDLTNLRGLTKILPQNREAIVSEYYEIFKNLYNQIIDFIERLESKS